MGSGKTSGKTWFGFHPGEWPDDSSHSVGEEMRVIEENYRRITDDKRSFDIRFWQSQGDRAIFEAVSEMLRDYFLIRGKDADEFRLQRTVENFRKA
jgi:hypothetical protein